MKTQIFTLFIFITFFYTTAFAQNNTTVQNRNTETITIYPNPINEKGTIKINIEEPTSLKVEIFDLSGKKTMEIKNIEFASGNHKINFQATELKNGLYLCKITSDTWEKAQRMIVRH